VLAEGVETKAHLEFLRLAGCAQVQGFLFGQPIPSENMLVRETAKVVPISS